MARCIFANRRRGRPLNSVVRRHRERRAVQHRKRLGEASGVVHFGWLESCFPEHAHRGRGDRGGKTMDRTD